MFHAITYGTIVTMYPMNALRDPHNKQRKCINISFYAMEIVISSVPESADKSRYISFRI